ncbi:MAG: hypothetical protein WCV67_07265 [Victivallaceae bacterium]|jgi:hypothetical protein
MKIPLIFIHQGYNDYLNYTLRQAHFSNPDAEIILIGDESNDKFDFVKHYRAEDYQRNADAFAGVYKHMSFNSYEFELICFKRWFILEDFMIQHQLHGTFVFDTDVMIYSDLTAMAENLSDSGNNGFAVTGESSLSPHVIFWQKQTLSSFNQFLLESYSLPEVIEKYQQKWTHHISNKLAGGICDMTALCLFNSQAAHVQYQNLLKIEDDATFDLNINESSNLKDNEFVKTRGQKKIIWNNNQPYAIRKSDNREIRFHALHLQGHAKLLLDKYYRGPDFRERKSISLHNKLRIFKGGIRRLAAYSIKSICGKPHGSLYFP